ncbi:MAG: hypothetical protein MJ252_03250 [archaeon]|nr:hypothetical protein [archaeon]
METKEDKKEEETKKEEEKEEESEESDDDTKFDSFQQIIFELDTGEQFPAYCNPNKRIFDAMMQVAINNQKIFIKYKYKTIEYEGKPLNVYKRVKNFPDKAVFKLHNEEKKGINIPVLV